MEERDFCLYHFYSFDDWKTTQSGESGVRTMAILADQLIELLYRKDRRIAAVIGCEVETVELNMAALQKIFEMIVEERMKQIEKQQGSRGGQKMRLYIFLDGLDDERFKSESRKVARLFRDLEAKLPIIVRLWISTQSLTSIEDQLGRYQIINLDEYARGDVQKFLAETIPKFDTSIGRNRKIDEKPCTTFAFHARDTKELTGL